MSDDPRILAVDTDRVQQTLLAQTFNDAGLFYRFVTDPRKLEGALGQLKPDLILVHSEINGELLAAALDVLLADVSTARLPIVLLADSLTDQPFVDGLRSSVIGFLQKPFNAQEHIAQLRELWAGMPTRHGQSSGEGDATIVQRLFDHLGLTRRSGEVILNPRTAEEARASFALGRIESASMGPHVGQAALDVMAGFQSASWVFEEMGGNTPAAGGVVIEVGTTGEVPIIKEIPLDPVPAPAPAPFEVAPIPAPVPSAPRQAPSSSTRLLIVDDDEALARMFATMFKKRGFDVTTAADGALGYEAAERAEFDAVVADLNMPRLDGWGMLRALRDDFRTRELPVAFLSCHDDYRESLKALNAGAQAYFSKGTRLDALVTQVTKLLEPRQAVAAAIDAGQDFDLDIGRVGPQWFLKELERRSFRGKLEAKDTFAAYQLFIDGGSVVHAAAQAGRFTAEGEKAFNAFVASRNMEGHVSFGTFPSPQSLGHPIGTLLARACENLNENERRMRENMMVGASAIEVDPDLYAVYQQVGPKQWLEPAKLLCEERLAPREVIARLDTSPLELEEMMRDLIRRGVLTLKRA